MKKCPSCAEEIQDEAKKCRHCGDVFGQSPKDFSSNSSVKDLGVNPWVISIGLFLVALLLAYWFGAIAMWGMIIASSIWVFMDAKKIGVKKGQITGIANLDPGTWLVVCLFLWVIAFPMYLIKRPEFIKANAI
ncbi:MAG: zinc-ribbon domain-containing protein [Candidatus Omnitrophota bacterium]